MPGFHSAALFIALSFAGAVAVLATRSNPETSTVNDYFHALETYTADLFRWWANWVSFVPDWLG